VIIRSPDPSAGRDAIGFWRTILVGIAGSFAGGFVAWALFGWDEDQHDEWAVARRYFSETSMTKLYTTRDTDPAATAELEPGD
jgi:hypothetical protein